jgi:Putative  PD-(D/E)XK family member, (DUF4420)
MMKIEKIWDELESDLTVLHGLLLRRFSSDVLPEIFVALKTPEKSRGILISISKSITLDISAYATLRDISIDVFDDEKNLEKKTLFLKLLDNQHKDIFSVLCEDLILSVSKITNEKVLIKELLNRFGKWKSLFDKSASQGLSKEEQIGLFGELFFVRKCLQNTEKYLDVVNSWVGSEGESKDFQLKKWGVEVKTSAGKSNEKVNISSEQQLDTSNFEKLFLYHLSLQSKQEDGETLNEIIDSVSTILAMDFNALNRFKNKLLIGGYFQQHSYLYEKIGYLFKEENFYEVRDEFPRIEEKDIGKQIADVKYTIYISQCSEFVITEKEVFQTIFEYE